MPSRLRDQHLHHVLEALMQYADAGGILRFESDGVGAETRITFVLMDGAAYDARLSSVMMSAGSADDSAGSRPLAS